LNAADDPGWKFLESRFKWITSRLSQAYNEYLAAIEKELKPSKTHPGSATPPDLEQYLAFVEAARSGRTSELAFFIGK
jgi:CRISPR/Cas system-associated protein Cas10 (large subunit of type III CRISPR-Cas system)